MQYIRIRSKLSKRIVRNLDNIVFILFTGAFLTMVLANVIRAFVDGIL